MRTIIWRLWLTIATTLTYSKNTLGPLGSKRKKKNKTPGTKDRYDEEFMRSGKDRRCVKRIWLNCINRGLHLTWQKGFVAYQAKLHGMQCSVTLGSISVSFRPCVRQRANRGAYTPHPPCTWLSARCPLTLLFQWDLFSPLHNLLGKRVEKRMQGKREG